MFRILGSLLVLAAIADTIAPGGLVAYGDPLLKNASLFFLFVALVGWWMSDLLEEAQEDAARDEGALEGPGGFRGDATGYDEVPPRDPSGLQAFN